VKPECPITRPDGWTVAKSQIEAAVGQADVVENRVQLVAGNHVPDFILDIGEKHLGFFDACAGGARACSRICPESTVGKKSLPTR